MKPNLFYTIYILWLRQIKRYFRSKSRMIGSLGQPILFLFALGYGLKAVIPSGDGGSYLQFLSPGIIAMTILFSAIFSGIEVIWDRQFGFLKETLVAPVSRVTIMFGRTLGGATTALFQGVLVLVISLLAGFRPDFALIIPAIIFMFLISLLFTALGTGIGSILEDMQGFQLIMNFLAMPLFFLSGALFPLDTAPTALRVIAYVNPLSYGVDALRATLVGVSHFGLWIDTSVLVGLTIIFIGIGGWLFSRIKV